MGNKGNSKVSSKYSNVIVEQGSCRDNYNAA